MARIDCTRILVAAPGLRPTAVAAAPPIRPTPMAEPSAARPTWMLPIMSSCLSLTADRRPVGRDRSSDLSKSFGVHGGGCFLLVLTDEEGEDGGEEHEHEGLDDAHEELHEVEGDGEQPAEPRD